MFGTDELDKGDSELEMRGVRFYRSAESEEPDLDGETEEYEPEPYTESADFLEGEESDQSGR